MKKIINHKITAIILLGFFLRLIYLNQSLWLDEAINVLAVKNFNFSDLITKYSQYDFHPPLYHIILYFWTKIFGYTEITVRFPSIIFSLLSVAVVYKIGSEFFSKKIGLAASLLLALSPFGIHYSQEARMYSLTMFLATITFYFFLCLLNKRFKFLYIMFFTLFMILGFYSDYIFWIFGLLLIVFLYKKSAVEKVWLSLSLSLIFLFISPWLKLFLSQLFSGISQAKSTPLWGKVVGEASIKNLLLVPVKFSIGRISFYNKTFYSFFVSIILFLETCSIYLGYRKLKNKTSPFMYSLLIPVAITFIISIFIPVFFYFRLLFLLPILYLLISFGLSNATFGKTLISLIVFFQIVSLSIYFINPRFRRENWKEAVNYIESNSNLTSAALIVNISQDAPYKYYAKSVPIIDEKNLNSSYDKIWFIRYAQPIFDPKDNTLKKVENLGYKKNQEKDFNGVTIWEYKK